MIVESCKLENFRNYKSAEIKLHPGTNLFYGDNAQGKTNILEAVYVCGTTKSHRGSRDMDMISFGQDEAHIRVQILKHETPWRVDMHLKKNKSKGIAINGLPIRRAGELVGLGHYVFFSPEDLAIVKNGPQERRRFIDMELCQLHSSYLHDLASYNRVLLQRGRLLKNINENGAGSETLDVWDEQLISYGSGLIEERERFVFLLQDMIEPIHKSISGGKEKLRVTYEKNVSVDTFAEQVFRNREKDIRTKMTNCGPHRDDLKLEANDNDLRRYGSQGQVRTAALSLKLAEIELVKRECADTPVLMLDDVLSELDRSRQQYLLESIKNVQTLVTGTGIEGFEKRGFRIDRTFLVRSGTCEQLL